MRTVRAFSAIALICIVIVGTVNLAGCSDSTDPEGGGGSGGPFVGNTETKKYHTTGCSRRPTVNATSLSDCDAVREGGYSACAYCRPGC